jgi:ATP-dependent Lon protease
MLPWNSADLTFDETRFSGAVRLFPLPDLVMFPHVMQPLHIFEPRYREMLNEALDSDGLIAMSILAPAGIAGRDGRPAVLPQVCVGKVVTHQRLDDGCYNIMLLGMRRARVVEELATDESFRRAEVELLDDIYRETEEPQRATVQAMLAKSFQAALPLPPEDEAKGAVRELLGGEIPIGVLTDLVSFALPLPASLKRALLAECDVDRRARALLGALKNGAPEQCINIDRQSAAPRAATKGFPPRFSAN